MNPIGLFKSVLQKLKSYKESKKLRQEWRDKNLHNHTTIRERVPDNVEVGNETYGPIWVKSFGNKEERLKIGNYCSIAEDVLFLLGGNHTMSTFSQFPFDAYFNTEVQHITPTKGPIIVEDDVWIGYGATILSGVTIGQGAIIGARSVVSKNVPPYAVYVGNRVVKYRYPDTVAEKMLRFDFSKLSRADIESNSDILRIEVDETFFETEFYKSHLKEQDNI